MENLEKLEAEIDDFDISAPFSAVRTLDQNFGKITFNSLSFEYTNKEGEVLFSSGPVDFDISEGEILFIVGGNGSGKSTLLKLLTGLYYPMAGGYIQINGQRIGQHNYQAYRELFSVIFTDFHLFRKLYGLDDIDEEEVRSHLQQMKIEHKTAYIDKKFTNLDLSTGQRKRLAYITALLDDKPIYVFDEWAADQDPLFRRLFYEKFLKDLRAMNKTIIAVTHDDRFFDKADRIIKTEEGKIESFKI